MKIGLIVPANIKYSPYIQYYIDVLEKCKVEYRIMSWNKAGINESADMVFDFQTSDFDRKKMLLGHALFAKKCKQYIKIEEIDCLIIFTIAPLFFLGYSYLKRYRSRVIMDVRDDSPFRRLFFKRLNDFGELADMLVVSSPCYSKWFNRESILCHNVDLALVRKYEGSFENNSIYNPIRIVFAGMMIEEDINIEVIDKLKNDVNFELVYIGRDNEKKDKIKEYVTENSIQNVVFKGEYKKEDIVDIYRKEADLVNILRKDTIINRNALPNKLYDAVMSGIPLVVYFHNKAIADYVRDYSLGIVINDKDAIGEQIIKGIENFDFEQYRLGREQFIGLVKENYRVFGDRLGCFCRK